jgi:transcriptional regulator with XRE-family HTH domain
MAAKPQPNDLDRLVGYNVRRLRTQLGASHDDIAQALRDRGWERASGSVLVNLEAGKRGIRFAEVLVLADALNVAVADFLEPDPDAARRFAPIPGANPRDYPFVSITENVADSPRWLAKRLTSPPRSIPQGRGVKRPPRTWTELEGARRDAQLSAGRRGHSVGDEALREAECHAAGRLNVSPAEVVQRSYARWKQTLSEERDERAASRTPADSTPRQRAAIRAHVTRHLLDELREENQ